MFKNILICTDGSPASKKAAQKGVALAKALGASVTAYYAMEAMPWAMYDENARDDAVLFGRFEARERKFGERYAGSVGKLAAKAALPFKSVVAKATSPYQGIVDMAAKQKCDAIVIASHGRSGFSKLMLGSVTQKVLGHTKLPVIVFR